MTKKETLEIKKLVTGDKKHIQNFLERHLFQVLKDSIEYLFSEDKIQYKNLWELESEPLSVKVIFNVHLKNQDQVRIFQGIAENLSRADNPVLTKRIVNNFRDFIGKDIPLTSLNQSICETYILKKYPTAKHYAHLQLRHLKAFFNKAIEY